MIKKSYGFTIAELLVVMVIIGILTTLVTVQVTRGRLIARDNERENDVKIITTFLENTYKSGQSDGIMIPAGDGSVTNAVAMGYPSTVLISNQADSQSKAILGAIEPNALKSPFKGSFSLVAAATAAGASGNTAGGVPLGPNATDDNYVYQPLTNGGAVCLSANDPPNISQKVIAPRLIDACVKYNVYYFSEKTNSVVTMPSVNSNNNGL